MNAQINPVRRARTVRNTLSPAFVLIAGAASTLLAPAALAGPVQEAYAARVINFANGTPTTSGVYDRNDTYTIGGVNYEAWLRPAKVAEINNTAGEFFFTQLNTWAGASGWTFQSAVNTLTDNSLKVRTYDVQGSATRIGAELHVEYVPGVGDPVNNVHWIQVIRNNHNLVTGYGNLDLKVDNLGSTSPYYDHLGAATDREFYDFPGRTTNLTQRHYWDAELFLATGPAAGSPGMVTLYRTGMRWGWETVPTPSSMALLGLSGLVASRRKR